MYSVRTCVYICDCMCVCAVERFDGTFSFDGELNALIECAGVLRLNKREYEPPYVIQIEKPPAKYADPLSLASYEPWLYIYHAVRRRNLARLNVLGLRVRVHSSSSELKFESMCNIRL